MKAADIMTTKVVTLGDQSSVRDAAKLLLKHGISAAPVVDTNGKLLGIVSEGDLMRRADIGTSRRRSWWLRILADSESSALDYIKENSRRVTDVMTEKVISATRDTPLAEIARLLEKNCIKRIPIVEQEKVIGIVSRSNLIQGVASLGKTIPAADKSDAAIRDQVLVRLQAEPWKPWMLNVLVHNGQVDLWGIVNSDAQKRAARVAAEITPGVKAVNDNVVIRPAVGE